MKERRTRVKDRRSDLLNAAKAVNASVEDIGSHFPDVSISRASWKRLKVAIGKEEEKFVVPEGNHPS